MPWCMSCVGYERAQWRVQENGCCRRAYAGLSLIWAIGVTVFEVFGFTVTPILERLPSVQLMWLLEVFLFGELSSNGRVLGCDFLEHLERIALKLD